MKVSEVMTRDVQTVRPDQPVQEAASFMLSADAGSIPVTDGDRLIGMIQPTEHEDKVLTITVKPGWKSGTKVTFPKEGDQVPGRIPADIAFTIKVINLNEYPHL